MKLTSVLLPVAALAATTLALPAPASAKAPARPHDFNGDGRTDLVVNGPTSVKRGAVGEGLVAILYGKTGRKQVITRDSAGVSSVAEHGDGFGFSTASADFDRDGYADLAITGPDEDGVTIVYGSKKGLSARAAFLRTETTAFAWGNRLAVGDFDRDGRADLVATVRNRYWIFSKIDKGKKPTSRTGSVIVDDEFIPDELVPAVGDFTGDGRNDLILGAGKGTFSRLLKGSASGLSAPVSVPWLGPIETAAVGDFNGDGRDDLATANGNDVSVRLGRSSGLTKPRSVAGSVSGAPITSTSNSIAVADVDRDGKDDLAIGAPYRGAAGAGRVVLLHGHKSGVTTKRAQVFSQKNKGLKAGPERGDKFGWSVRLLDLTGDRRPELAIGSPGEDRRSGRLYVLARQGGKITTRGARTYGPRDFGLSGSQFGFRLLP
ncbi:FG-GAP-like repeat-containing protein [Actinocorallia aurantiaca]|uniref:FG-GAP repeat protein n=1 Tax=Actinocorallia aurantiaca TaxID=46204 RepID=A0ABN3UIP5_9ACTN